MKNKKKSGRFRFRIFVFLYCLWSYCFNKFKKRDRPAYPKSFLIAHHLLLGDTLMLTPLLAKLRRCYPDAIIYFLLSEQYVDLYEKSPYQIKVVGYNPRSSKSFFNLRKIVGSVDIALIPGDNRFSSLAYSLGAKWIVAFEDLPAQWLKNLFVDEFVEMPSDPISWEDMNLMLVRCNDSRTDDFIYNKNDWPSPAFKEYQRLDHYIILHVGATNPLRYWQAEKWFELANKLETMGYQVVWTASPQERFLIQGIDPNSKFKSYCDLSLAQLWNLMENAELVVCPDTGVSHLAKLTNTPVIVLFGQGSDVLFGKGEFFKGHPFYKAIIVENIPCRDMNLLFKRPVPWVRRCNRTLKECQHNLCMEQISVDVVYKAVIEFQNVLAEELYES